MAEFSWDGKGRRWYSFGKGKQSELLPDHGVSLKAACGASPGSPPGTPWRRECGSRPGKDGGVQNPFGFYFVTYSRIKSKHFIVSGTVRGHGLVCNRAAFILDLPLWSVTKLSSAFLRWHPA